MNWLYLAAGVLLLFLGKKAFWLFVAIVGFLLGFTFAPDLLPGQTQSVYLTISLVTGLLGALLSVLLQKFAIGMAGLVAGGYVTYSLLQMAIVEAGQYQWLIIAAGALLGAVLAGSMFDWAMILITSVCGSVLIYQGASLDFSFGYILLIGLVLLGIIVQGKIKSSD